MNYDNIIKKLEQENEITFIVQIGAYNGCSLGDPLYKHLIKSNKFKALLIEPLPRAFKQLKQIYKDKPFIFENVAIAEKTELKDFYCFNDYVDATFLHENGMPDWLLGFSSLRAERITTMWDDYVKQNPQFQVCREFLIKHTIKTRVQCYNYNELLSKHNINKVDILNIDTEGYDYKIIKTIDFSKNKPRVIHYESVILGEEDKLCKELLSSHGYIFFDNWQDTICIQKDDILLK